MLFKNISFSHFRTVFVFSLSLVVPVVSDVSVFRMFRFRSQFRFRYRFFLQEPNLRDVVPPVAKSQPPLDVIDLENHRNVAIKGQHSRSVIQKQREKENILIYFSIAYRPIQLPLKYVGAA